MTNNKVYKTGGKKDLAGKLPVHLVTEHMIAGIAEGLNCGIKKGYEKHNWKKGLPICEAHLAAALRHIGKYMSGTDTNVETDKEGNEVLTHHLDNALTHLAMAVHQIKSGRTDLDDRDLDSWLLSQEALADVKLGLAQAKQGLGKPLSFNLEDDDAFVSRKYSHDWGFDIDKAGKHISRQQALRDQFKDRDYE